LSLRSLATTLACLLFAVPVFAQEIYNNGPINGTTDAWTINSGFSVTDTFTVSGGNGSIGGMSFGAWAYPGDVLENAEVLITSEAFGGTTYSDQVVSFSQSGCSMNQYGLDVCTETGFFNGPNLANGTYWIELTNAVVNDGDPIFWDENSGVGCTSPGCPSEAETQCIKGDNNGCIPSESFTVLSSNETGSVPEPGSAVLFGSGFLTVLGIMRRKLR
jgi:hypothetical protein